MLCEKETTQGIELYVNGVLKKITLCEQCLMKVSLGINLFPLLFASFLQTFDNVNKQELIQNPDTNEPMCQQCFELFRMFMGPMLVHIHNKYHIKSNDNEIITKIKKLENEIKKAVAEERFEDAAKLKKELDQLKKNNNEEKNSSNDTSKS